MPTATSLALEGHDVDRTDLLLALLAELDGQVTGWPSGRQADEGLRAAYVDHCVDARPHVGSALPSGETVDRTAVDVDSGGRLVVETRTGPTSSRCGRCRSRPTGRVT